MISIVYGGLTSLFILLIAHLQSSCFLEGADFLTPKVTLKVDKFVAPFDDQAQLPLERDVKHFFPIGQIKTFGTNLSEPYFYPANFSIYTRQGNLDGIRVQSLVHRLIFENVTSGLDMDKFRRYEFNLTEIQSPYNPFDVNRRTIVLVPGYLDGNLKPKWLSLAVQYWLELADVNVIVVDWLSKGQVIDIDGNIKSDSYDTIVANTRIVGRQITLLIYYISIMRGIDFNEDFKFRETISLVGHSLGAHIAGFTAQELLGHVNRLTCLDPAGPIFDTFEWEDRLNTNMAKFVDVIQTNSGKMDYISGEEEDGGKQTLLSIYYNDTNLIDSNHANDNVNMAKLMLATHTSNDKKVFFGMLGGRHQVKMAHVSYVANGGSKQPGCSDNNKNNLPLCDHQRATLIYTNILEYELKSRLAYGPESEIIRQGYHRPVAFPAPNYQTFKEGDSLFKNCPDLISKHNFLLSSKERYESYKRCTIPIDLIKSGIEFRKELEESYGMTFINYNNTSKRKELTPTENKNKQKEDDEHVELPSNYFETSSLEPLISEHYLLRIHLPKENSNENHKWTNGCKLKVLAQSKNNNLFAEIQLNTNLLEPMDFLGDDIFYGLTLPFANPIDWRVEQMTPFVLNEIFRDNSDNQAELFKRIQNLLPNFLSISLTYGDDVSGQNSTSEEKDKEFCKLTINNVEARPLAGVVYDILGWYRAANNSVGFDSSVRKYSEVVEIMSRQDNNQIVLSNIKKKTVILDLMMVGYELKNNTGYNE